MCNIPVVPSSISIYLFIYLSIFLSIYTSRFLVSLVPEANADFFLTKFLHTGRVLVSLVPEADADFVACPKPRL